MSTRRKSAWFAFYADDWTGGTRGMSLAGRGAFLDLLCYQFAHGSVPADERKICRIIGAFEDEWSEIRAEVLAKFEATGGGEMVNERMRKERSERESIRQAKIEAGRAGAESRWRGNGTPNGSANGSANGDATVLPIASTSTSTSLSKTTAESKTKTTATPESVCVGEPLVSLETAKSNAGTVAPQIVEQWWNSREALGWTKNGQPIKKWQADLAAFNSTYLQNHADRNNGAAPKFAKQTKPAALPPEPDGWREAYQREYGHDITGDWSIQSNWQRAEILEMMNGSTQ